MNGERFLFGLREVIVSERILACKSLLKRSILFWNEDIAKDSIECKPTLRRLKMKLICL